MNKTIIWVLGIIIVVGIIILVAVKPGTPETGEEVGENGTDGSPAIESETVVVVQMTNDGFNPSEVTIKQGETVEFENVGTNDHWPASAIHPTHEVYPEFDPKAGVAPGESWSFTFDKVGEWKFHDHLFLSFTGKITVTE